MIRSSDRASSEDNPQAGPRCIRPEPRRIRAGLRGVVRPMPVKRARLALRLCIARLLVSSRAGLRVGAALFFALCAAAASADPAYLLKPARVFDGVDLKPHEGWSVLVRGDKIEAVGPSVPTPPDATLVDLAGKTLMPGMIEGHSHLFLHPYNETSWDDQVLHEPLALRTARATISAKATLLAGFTTVRDLGTEGAGYADVGLKQAIQQGVIPGPRMLVATRALVATGAYGPM